MTNLTPGPWAAGPPAWFRGRMDPEAGKRPITAGAHGVVANVYGAENARLIATAPELLEALKTCVSVIDQLMGDSDPLEETSALVACQRACAAIAKAEARK